MEIELILIIHCMENRELKLSCQVLPEDQEFFFVLDVAREKDFTKNPQDKTNFTVAQTTDTHTETQNSNFLYPRSPTVIPTSGGGRQVKMLCLTQDQNISFLPFGMLRKISK